MSLILVLHTLLLYHLLEAEKYIFVAVNLFFELLLAGLSLFNLQVERFHVALNLLDALDYLLFKYFLTMFYDAAVVTATTSDTTGSPTFRIKLDRLTLVLGLSVGTAAQAFRCRSIYGAVGGPQVIQLQISRVTHVVLLHVIVGLQAGRQIF